MKPAARLNELDLLRFIAAFSVMFFHFTTRGNTNPEYIPIQYPALSAISRYAYLGVDLFFIISGFVIFMSAVDRSAKSFAISRLVRLYPAYWVCCTLTFVVTLIWGVSALKVSPFVYMANMTMLHDYFGISHVDGVYWSLFLEMKFYLFVFLVILFKQMHRAKYFLALWLLVSVLALEFPSSIVETVLITHFSAYFISGAVFYLIWKEGLDLFKGVLLLGAYILAICKSMDMLRVVVSWYHFSADSNVVIGLVTLFYVVFFMLAFKKLSFIRGEFLVMLGSLTYPLYLLHERIGFVIFKSGHTVVQKHLLLVLIMALMCVLAYTVHVRVEKRFAPQLKKFLERLFSFGVSPLNSARRKPSA
jgi:peptidoglycan/LPS O-acetylase OafA/YrhL